MIEVGELQPSNLKAHGSFRATPFSIASLTGV